jgi:hypothetical protein
VTELTSHYDTSFNSIEINAARLLGRQRCDFYRAWRATEPAATIAETRDDLFIHGVTVGLLIVW